MEKTELKSQIEAAFDRITQARILLESIAGGTAHSHAQDIAGLLGKVDREMFNYRGNLRQQRKI